MKPTIKDVAAASGVSYATVSYVLNDKRGNYSEETRQRVLEVARQVGYEANALAKSLRSRQSGVIGIYSGYDFVSYARDPFFSEIIGGMQRGCSEQEKHLLLRTPAPDSEQAHRELLDGRIDGLVVVAQSNDSFVEWLRSVRLPVVAVADAIPSLPSVVADEVEGARLLAVHLSERGYKHVLYRGTPVYTASSFRRATAFHQFAAAQGMTVSDLIPPSSENGTVRLELSEAEKAALRVAASTDYPQVVVCFNDLSAYDVLSFCLSEGIRVPGQLAVTGFDGFSWPVPTAFQLTTVRLPWPEVARTAVRLLSEQMAGGAIAGETVLPVQLRPGNTT